ncbi:MFS transporter [Sphingobium sp.]|uniref:MFS transporter n=1 Tax=Sphingobium sp. TaxID=1912891 RepID=UPI002ED41946
MWQLPFVAMLGIAGAATFGFSSGVFMEAMTSEFGWTRSQFSSAFAVQMIAGLFIMPVAGRLIDKVGPRRVALTGIVLYVLAFSAFGLANGDPVQWLLLGALQVVGLALVSPPVWLSAVIPRFHASRGLALSIALAGVGVATAVWPILAALAVKAVGWRLAFPVLALGWAAIMLPLTLFFIRDLPKTLHEAPPGMAARAATTAAAKGAYRDAIFSRDCILITLAGGILCCVVYGITLHIVPILQSSGMSLTEAAGLAGLTGIASIVGRLGTGALLDYLPTRPLALIIFLISVLTSLLLWHGGGNWVLASAAVIILGLASGAETDVLVFSLSRRFGHEIFASIYAVVSAFLALFASMGPLMASALFDRTKSYDAFLLATVPFIMLSALLIWIALAPKKVRNEAPLSA